MNEYERHAKTAFREMVLLRGDIFIANDSDGGLVDMTFFCYESDCEQILSHVRKCVIAIRPLLDEHSLHWHFVLFLADGMYESRSDGAHVDGDGDALTGKRLF